jgi:acetyl coenzyme A synthetase (ADP forming)-like protein
MHPAPPPFPALTGAAADPVVLRDGSVAALRPATAADREAVRAFFRGLSPESRWKRFLGDVEPTESAIDRMCSSPDPANALTLVAWRQHPGGPTAIAIASYASMGGPIAEAAFAVDDRFQGKGIGTALLERLAAIGASRGFRWFQATVLHDNQPMLDVFRDSGFEVRSRSDNGLLDIRLNLAPSARTFEAMDERNRQATVASLEPILKPRAIAVIGVSRDPARLGRRLFDALLAGGYAGAVHAVNPAGDVVAGHRCLNSARDLPRGVDMAVVVVPRDGVLGVVDDCAAAGVRALVVVSAGFAEAGDEGRDRQRALVDRTRGYGMRLVGPNCMGVVNASPAVSMNASFAGVLPPPGRIALASQSGGLGLAILKLAAERQLGLSTFVSLGNKADVSGNDLLQYDENDPDTRVILLYLESFGNPRRFAQLARRIGRRKPIVAVKSGRTRAGSRAAGSHTAGLASSETAVSALFLQSGVIRADTIDEMFDIAACLDLQPLPAGRRVAIVTNAGGPGILAADACEGADLTVADLTAPTRRQLAQGLDANASLANPVDLVASAGPSQYRHAVETLLAANEVDSLVVIYLPIDQSQAGAVESAIGEAIAAARGATATRKPVLACLMLGGARAPLRAGGESLPTYTFPENAVRALGKIAAYSAWRAEPPGLYWGFDAIHAEEARALCRDVVAARGDAWLTPDELSRVLNAFGLPMVPGVIARSEQDAAALAAIMGFPVALKISAPDAIHKTETGGIRLNLPNEAAVRVAYRDIAARLSERDRASGTAGVFVQPMVTGVETMIGLTEDPVFGPLVAFGLGGTQVEVVRDVGFRIAPLTDRDADQLIRGIRGYPLLEGYRGQPPADLVALREVLLRVSLIGQHVPEVAELDLNPVMAFPVGHGCRVVDARVRVAASSSGRLAYSA